jgi:hypothetical protein
MNAVFLPAALSDDGSSGGGRAGGQALRATRPPGRRSSPLPLRATPQMQIALAADADISSLFWAGETLATTFQARGRERACVCLRLCAHGFARACVCLRAWFLRVRACVCIRGCQRA